MKHDSNEKEARRKYDEQFKLNAVRLVENGQAARSVAQSLGISEGLLHKWKSARNQNRSELEAELIETKARLRQVEQERDILKKACAIFSRQS